MTVQVRIDKDQPGAPHHKALAAALAAHLGVNPRHVTSGELPMEWGRVTPSHVTLRTNDRDAVREAAAFYLDPAHVQWRLT